MEGTVICPNCQKDIADGSNFCYACGARQAAPPPSGYAPYGGYERRRLVRSINDRKIGGVCAGVADYFDLDPTLVRVFWLLLILCAGLPIVAYFICWLVLPEGYTGGVTTTTASPGR